MANTIIMPQLGETVAEGKILTWFKAVGDDVKIGDRLFEVETDKVTVEVEATVAGTLTDIKIGNGVTAKVCVTVAVIGGDAVAPAPKPVEKAAPAAPTKTMNAFEEVFTPTAQFGNALGPEGLRITPLARRLIAERGLDVNEVARAATAKGLRKIEEKDVSGFTASAPSAPTPPPMQFADGEVVTLNNIRARTGEKLAENWRNIPHVFQAIDVDFTEVEAVRIRHKERFKAETGMSLTYLPFIARAVCIALQAFPHVNARFDGKQLILSKDINLGIAVDLNHNGLVVPVIRDADKKGLIDIAKEMGLDNMARSRKQDIIFAGGCEELDWTLSVLFDAMGAMSSKYNDKPSTASRASESDAAMVSMPTGPPPKLRAMHLR